MLFTRFSLLFVDSPPCGTHAPVQAPVAWPGVTSRAEVFSPQATELSQLLCGRYTLSSSRGEPTFHARDWGLAKPKSYPAFQFDVIKSIVSPGQAALRETLNTDSD
jgi:hypothetical protein